MDRTEEAVPVQNESLFALHPQSKSQLPRVMRSLIRSDIPVCANVDCLWRLERRLTGLQVVRSAPHHPG
jgi:hypothetical protein